MLFGDEELFALVRSAKLGHIELPPILAQLRDWIHSEFGVCVVHIVFDHVELGPATGRPRINVILETDDDYDSWKSDLVTIRPDINGRVLSQFKEFAQTDPRRYDTDKLFLILDNFAGECLGRACSAFLETDADRITTEFSATPICRIDGHSRHLVVFLKTENDVRLRTEDGTCAEISNRCFDAVKSYDEFGYLSPDSFRLKFDSKENLDKNYNGSLFFYWR